jgi:hypothetical protein
MTAPVGPAPAGQAFREETLGSPAGTGAGASSRVARRPSLPLIPVFPVLLLAAAVLAAFVESASPMVALWRPLIVVGALVLGLQLALTATVRSRHLGGYFAALVALLLVAPWGALLLTLVALTPMVWGLVKRHRMEPVPWTSLTRMLNPLAAILVGVGIVSAGQAGAFVTPAPLAAPGVAASGTPDVYLLLLDGYPRADTLAAEFGFDNEPFLDALRELGFTVADESHSNYPMTALTLASLLNARHLDDLVPDPASSPAGQYRQISRLISEGSMIAEARRLGYVVTSIPSPFTVFGLYGADEVVNAGALTEFDISMLQQGVLPWVLPGAAGDMVLDQHRRGIDRTFDIVLETARRASERPRLVFGHVMAPHPPTVFAADGSSVDGAGCYPRCNFWEAGDTTVARTVGQIAHVNERTLETVREILAVAGDRPPVVVVFSDHGSRHDVMDKEEAVSNMLMAFTPDGRPLFESDSSPINVFPRILNRYAGADVRMAAEAEIFSLDWWATRERGLFPLERMQ